MIKDSSASFMEDVCLMVWYAMSKKHTLNHGGLTSEFSYLAIGKNHTYAVFFVDYHKKLLSFGA